MEELPIEYQMNHRRLRLRISDSFLIELSYHGSFKSASKIAFFRFCLRYMCQLHLCLLLLILYIMLGKH